MQNKQVSLCNLGKNVFDYKTNTFFSLQIISTNFDFIIYVLPEEPICKRKGTTSIIIKLLQLKTRAKHTEEKKVQTFIFE